MHKELKLILKNRKPYGIRDENGFLFFFSKTSRYEGQDERYREEIDEQYKLAGYLLDCLKNRKA